MPPKYENMVSFISDTWAIFYKMEIFSPSENDITCFLMRCFTFAENYVLSDIYGSHINDSIPKREYSYFLFQHKK